jgi:hypothetical protein
MHCRNDDCGEFAERSFIRKCSQKTSQLPSSSSVYPQCLFSILNPLLLLVNFPPISGVRSIIGHLLFSAYVLSCGGLETDNSTES